MSPHVNPTKSFLGDPIMVHRQEQKRGSMLYIVEVVMEDRSLAHELSQMRTWLDHMRFQAIGFRQVPGANICRVDFQAEQEARAFAQAFAGQVLNRTAA
jgi:hypothetical protein